MQRVHKKNMQKHLLHRSRKLTVELGEVRVVGVGLHKCPGSLYASNSSYLFWVAEKWEGRWVRILLLQVSLLCLIFFEVMLVLWCLVGRTNQHSEPARGVSPLVAGSRAPVGKACMEGLLPPLGIFLLDSHWIKVSCSIGSPGFTRRKWSLVHSCALAQSCNAPVVQTAGTDLGGGVWALKSEMVQMK